MPVTDGKVPTASCSQSNAARSPPKSGPLSQKNNTVLVSPHLAEEKPQAFMPLDFMRSRILTARAARSALGFGFFGIRQHLTQFNAIAIRVMNEIHDSAITQDLRSLLKGIVGHGIAFRFKRVQ